MTTLDDLYHAIAHVGEVVEALRQQPCDRWLASGRHSAADIARQLREADAELTRAFAAVDAEWAKSQEVAS